MANTLTIDLIAKLEGTYQATGGLTNALETIAINYTKSLTNGTGDNKADRFFRVSASAAAAAVTYDLDSGDLVDIYGNAITFTKIRALVIVNKSTTSGEILTIGGDWFTTKVLSGTTPSLDIQPDSTLFLTAAIDGYVVTATSADVLSIDPGANTISYDLILVGED